MTAKVGIWMPLYIGDYLSDTMHLTTEQHGAYLLIIMAYWKNGGELPGSAIQAITRMKDDAWSNAQAVLSMMFSIEETGNWRHERIERELEEAGKKKAGATAKAKAGAAARWGKGKVSESDGINVDATSIAQAMPEQCPSPSPSNTKIKSPCPQQADDGHKFRFAEIQDAYNRICSPTLPACRASNEARRRQVKRMVDLEFNGKRPFRDHGLEMWESYFRDCLTNKHWVGENDRGWRADFDFVTQPKNAIKLLERICG